MENRIDHLFKKRLGGAISTDSPGDKAAMLDALTKPKSKFRLWMLLPLLLLVCGAGWAIYEFGQNENELISRVEGTRSVGEKSQENQPSVNQSLSSNKPTVEAQEKVVKDAVESGLVDKVSRKPEVQKEHRVGSKNRNKSVDSVKESGIIEVESSEGFPLSLYEEYPNYFLNKNIVEPNEHSVEAISEKIGKFEFSDLPFGRLTPIKPLGRVWTITARGLIGAGIPMFGNVESTGGQLRNDHESAGISYGGELGIERTFGRWRAGSGVGFMSISNQVEYPIIDSEGLITVDSTMWTTTILTYYEVDSTFNPILGNWNYDTTYFTQIDSVGTDTSWVELAQIANGSLQKANGRNTISVISIPLQLQYKLMETDKLGSLHALAGLQWVYAYRRRGYYVSDDGEDLVGLSQDPSFKRMNIHLNIGLDWRYPLTDRLFTTIQPVLNYSILDWQSGYDQRFITPVLKFGIGWKLK